MIILIIFIIIPQPLKVANVVNQSLPKKGYRASGHSTLADHSALAEGFGQVGQVGKDSDKWPHRQPPLL